MARNRPNLPDQLLDDLRHWVYAKDNAGRYLYANRSMCAALGLALADLQMQTDATLFKHRQTIGSHQSPDVSAHQTDTTRLERLTLPCGKQFTMRTETIAPPDTKNRPYASVWVSRPLDSEHDGSDGLVDDREKLHTLFDNIKAHLYIKDENKRYRYVNPPVAAFFGRQPEDILGKRDSDIFPADIAQSITQTDAPVYDAHIPLTVEESLTTAHGDQRNFVSVKIPWTNKRGMTELLGISTDITALVRVRQFEGVRTNVLESIARGEPLRKTLEKLIQQTEALNPGIRCSILLLSEDGKRLGRAIAPSMPEGFAPGVEGMVVSQGMGSCGAAVANGQTVIVQDTATHPNWALFRDFAKQMAIAACWSEPIKNADDQVLGALAFHHRVRAIPDDRQREELAQLGRLAGLAIATAHGQDLIRNFAFRDALTGLANRRALDQQLQETLARCRSKRAHAAVILLDLDNFKPLNDQYGHQAGDDLLVQVSQRLLKMVRESDCVARIGGDEFVVLANHLDSDRQSALRAAMAIAEKLRINLGEPYFVETQSPDARHLVVEHHCTASFGVKLIDSQSPSPVELLMAADRAMYCAKDNGRNRVACADTFD